MRRDKTAYIIAIAAVLLVLLSAWWVLGSRFGNRTTVYIGEAVLSADIVTTPAERQRGLGGRDSLGDHQAMLFVFPSDQRWAIWMKNMKFPIDIVWLDASKKVVDIENNVAPETFPALFSPSDQARYVLELQAGLAQRKNIRVGTQAHFEITQ